MTSAPVGFLKAETAQARGSIAGAMAARIGTGLAGVALAWVLAAIVTQVVFASASLASIAPDLWLMVALGALRAGLSLAAEMAGIAASTRIRASLFRRLLDHADQLGPVRLSGLQTGEWVALAMDAVAGVDPYFRRWLPALAQVSVMPLAILAIALPFDWTTALVFLVTLPLLPVFMVLVGKAAEQASHSQWQSLTRLGGHMLDAIRGLVDLKLLNAADRMTVEVERRAEDYRRSTMSVLRLAFLSALVLEFFATGAIALVAVLVGFRLMWGTLDFQTGFFLLLLAPEFYAPLRRLGLERHAKMEAEAAAQLISDFLARPAPALPSDASRPDLSSIAICFEDVSVQHEDGRQALEDVSFEIRSGEHVALVGASGSGKSTVLALLSGFLQPSSGQILVNGIALDRIDPDHWRAHVALIPQKPHFFDASIAANVSLDGQADAEAIRATLESTGALAAIEALPDGLATPLGEGGHGLSGGEAQRLALARAFLTPAPIILADEPTAHLDRDTEADVADAMARLSEGRTMITIAHRLPTIARADRILVFSEGRVVEQGPPSALMAANGAYAAIVAAAGSGSLLP
jgi:ATP-binding cassette subfamily C protein CydD